MNLFWVYLNFQRKKIIESEEKYAFLNTLVEKVSATEENTKGTKGKPAGGGGK